jgi:hypothetical protein
MSFALAASEGDAKARKQIVTSTLRPMHSAARKQQSATPLRRARRLRKTVSSKPNRPSAAQRVVQAHGFRAFDRRDMTKRAATAAIAENELIKRADNIWIDDPGCSRTEALRKARLANPRL